MTALPSSLSYGATPADGTAMVAAEVRNPLASILTTFNALLSIFGGGTAGQVMQASSSTAIGWANPSMVQLFDSTLAVDTATFNATGLSGTFSSLQIVCYLRTDRAATSDGVGVRFNGDAGSNYDFTFTAFSGSTVSGTATVAAAFMETGNCAGSTAPANAFDTLVIEVPFYSGAVNHKTVTSRSGAKVAVGSGADLVTQMSSGWWRNTAAVTQVTILPLVGANFKAGSRCTIYGRL